MGGAGGVPGRGRLDRGSRSWLARRGSRPWTPQKLYRSTWFDTTATTLDARGRRARSGRRASRITRSRWPAAACTARRTWGGSRRSGRRTVRLALVEDRHRRGDAGDELFAGIDTTSRHAVDRRGGRRPGSSPGRQRAAWSAAGPIVAGAARRSEATCRDETRAGLVLTAGAAPGTAPSARASRRRRAMRGATTTAWCPGSGSTVALECWNAGAEPHASRPAPAAGERSAADSARGATPSARAGRAGRGAGHGRPSRADAPPTTPYFLRSPLQAGAVRLEPAPPALRGEPFDAARAGRRRSTVDGVGAARREVTFRFNDQARGEVRRPVMVVPRVDVKLDPATEVWPAGTPRAAPVHRDAHARRRDTTAGTVRWSSRRLARGAAAARSGLTREDEREAFVFEVRPPAAARRRVPCEIRAVARDRAGRRLRRRAWSPWTTRTSGRARTRPADGDDPRSRRWRCPRSRRVGYVRGASDRVPGGARERGRAGHAARRRRAASRAISVAYDAIVIGPRAYETDRRWSRTTGACSTTPGAAGSSSCSISSSRFSTAGSRRIR